MSPELPAGAVVHIIESVPHPGGPVLPDRVLVNGTDVGLLKAFTLSGGGPDEPTMVTLELYPAAVIIGHEP